MLRKVDGIGIAGLLMLAIGGYLIFSNQPVLPLWIAWLVGPLLWYAGFAVSVVWFFYRLFGVAAPREEEERAAAPRPVYVNAAASGRAASPALLREVPAMGAFIL